VFDLIVLSVLLTSAVIGSIRGATRELVSVMAFIVAVVSAILALPMSTPLVQKTVETEWLAKAFAVLFVFLAIYITLRIAGSILVSRIHQTRLGAVDRVIGLGFGLIRALVLLGAFNIVFHAATPPGRTPAWVLNARLYPLTSFCADALLALAPKGSAMADKVTPALKRSFDGSVDRSPESKRDKPAEGGYDAAAQKRLDDLVEKSL